MSLYEDFTGETTADEAKIRLGRLNRGIENENKRHEASMDFKCSAINEAVERINAVRIHLAQEDFKRFIEITRCFNQWIVGTLEYEKRYVAKVELRNLCAESKMLVIDFDRDPISSNLKALVSFGFWSRSEAQDSLKNVIDEETKFQGYKDDNCKIEIKVEAIRKTMEELARELEELASCYRKIMDQIEYFVALIRNSNYLLDDCAIPKKIDIELLPKKHRDLLRAADACTRILFKLSAYRYLNSESGLTLNDEECQQAKDDIQKFKQEFAIAA